MTETTFFKKANLFGIWVKGNSHLQPMHPLFRCDRKLFPHSVQPGKRIPRWSRGAAQRLAQHHRGLQQLSSVVVSALKEREWTQSYNNRALKRGAGKWTEGLQLQASNTTRSQWWMSPLALTTAGRRPAEVIKRKQYFQLIFITFISC